MRHFCVFALLSVAALPAADFRTGQAARLVIGQRTFTEAAPTASQTTLGGVGGLAYVNNTLFVADANRIGGSPVNNRVLIYSNLSTLLPSLTGEPKQGARCPACGAPASVVVGQPDFLKTDAALSQTGLRLPTAVASEGGVLAVADTDNNRILIWKTIPTANNAPADVVIGQTDFTKKATLIPPTATSMRGPQGVWIEGGKLFVADTQNHRILIYNSIPNSNGVAADLVLGQPDFTTFVEPDLTQAKVDAKANNMLNPVSVTSDGVRLYVTDLGFNRILIWNTIPVQNQQPADLALGQPDMTSAVSNNSTKLCDATGKDDKGNDTFPVLCSRTLSFPRFAISDGTWLFVADGGNDRVLVYRHVPTVTGTAPDVILGQPDGLTDSPSSGSDRLATPMSLAWDGANLFVSDTYNRRVVVYTLAELNVPPGAIRNAASYEVYAIGAVTLGGTIAENDEVTIKIVDKEYKYKVIKDDTFANVVDKLVTAINAAPGDPSVLATPNEVVNGVLMTSRTPGEAGNAIAISATLSAGAKITATASGATLGGGRDSARLASGTLVSIFGTNLSDSIAIAPETGKYLPTQLAGTQVYCDGIRISLLYVSPTQINGQIPVGVQDATSISCYVRTIHADKTVTATVPLAVPIVPENPGIFAEYTNDPRPGLVYHGSPYATGTVSVDGSVKAGDVGTIKIEDRAYTYTVKSTDTLVTIRDALIAAVDKDPKVHAKPAGVFTRVRLEARTPGIAGEGIAYSASVNTGATLLLTPTNTKLCCANTGRATTANPVIPGETIVIYATGLGIPVAPTTGFESGRRYDGPVNEPVEFVSSLAGGKTANVIQATPAPGMVGVWLLQLELNSDLPTNPLTQLTIAQNIYVSNIVTFPLKKP